MSDRPLVDALARSARVRSTAVQDLDAWLLAASTDSDHVVTEVPLDELRSWGRDPMTGDIVHRTGRFFAVRGIAGANDEHPIIDQPDVGILGFLGRVEDGILKVLIQAKVEPGNRRLAQLSPTVQATSSNFERVHGGAATPFVLSFAPDAGRSPGVTSVIDREQSEQSSRFLRKRNRNCLVLLEGASRGRLEEQADPERFRWVTLGDLHAAVTADDMLHMDSRSVMACLASAHLDPRTRDSTRAIDVLDASWSAAPDAGDQSLREITGWLEGWRGPTDSRTIPLASLTSWSLVDGALRRRGPAVSGQVDFEVVGVRVTSGSREITAWDQPLIRNHPGRDSLLIAQVRDGLLHVLVKATADVGTAEGVEVAPSLLIEGCAGDERPEVGRIRDLAAEGRTILDVRLPEEGGRFLHSSTRHQIVVLPPGRAALPGAGSRWVTLSQLGRLLDRPRLVNMELRSLIASCSPSLAWEG